MDQRRALFLLGIAYAGFVSLGLPDGLLGVAWPSIRATFGPRSGRPDGRERRERIGYGRHVTTPVTQWDPALYARFERERSQPFFDLVARIETTDVRRAVDLGCGSGELTRTLADRWPAASILGVDSSDAMLARAHEQVSHPRVRFEHADLRAWRPAEPLDCIVSNAALQWVGDHDRLLERLTSWLAPGGTLAVQMPHNDDAPTHTILASLWRDPRFAPDLGEPPPAVRVRDAAWYGERLLTIGCRPYVWETTYLHHMPDAAAIVEWVRGTALRPALSRLSGTTRDAFLAHYTERVSAAYPQGPHGVWFPFPRLFFVARKDAAKGG